MREKKQVRIGKSYIQNMVERGRNRGRGYGPFEFIEKYTNGGGYDGWETIFYTKVLVCYDTVIRTVIYIAGVNRDYKLYATDEAMTSGEVRRKILETVMNNKECLLFLNQNHPYFTFTFYEKKKNGIQ